MLPLVSVIITTYNRFEPAKRAIFSATRQTYRNLELIVVEDGSNSGIENWLKAEAFQNLYFMRHSENRGLSAARNTGLRISKGRFVAYLDDDDEWKPKRIEKQTDLYFRLNEEQRSLLGVIHCGNEKRYPNNSQIAIRRPLNIGKLKARIIPEGLKTGSSTFLFVRSALDAVGGFDEALHSSIDHDIWMKLAVAGYHAEAVVEPLVIEYDRLSRTGMMTDTLQRIQGVRQFCTKWEPVFREWFGQEAGDRYARKYFSRVISRLAADKAATGKFSEAWSAVKSVFAESRLPSYSLAVLVCTLLYVELRSIGLWHVGLFFKSCLKALK